MHTMYDTRDLCLAAFLKAHGHRPSLLEPDLSGFVTFRFDDPHGDLSRLAAAFHTGASVPALPFYHALGDLRGAIRVAQGGGR